PTAHRSVSSSAPATSPSSPLVLYPLSYGEPRARHPRRGVNGIHCYLCHLAVRVSVINDFDVVVAGVRALLSPYSDRVLVVDTQLQAPPDVAVDVALFDTFAAPLSWQSRLAELATHPGVRAVAVYSF